MKAITRYVFCIILLVCFGSRVAAQLSFSSLDAVFGYAKINNITVKTNAIRLQQAQKAKLAAVLSIPDVSGSILSGSFTNNTRLPVNIFPAEAFGGTPGTYKEIATGVQYTTTANNYLDVKLLNPQAWENLRLAKLNIDLTNLNSQMSLKNIYENIAVSYYNIINLNAQVKSDDESIQTADTIYQVVLNRYNGGLVKSQDVNDSKVALLTAQENKRQTLFLLEQQYTSFRMLCDIPDSVTVVITETPQQNIKERIAVENQLQVSNSLLQERIALSNIRNARLAFSPTASVVFSNSYQLFNASFKVLSGNWINSNYVGLKLNIPLPSANAMAKKYSAGYDYRIAQKNTGQAKLQAGLHAKQLTNDYQKTVSQLNFCKDVYVLQQDTYQKNRNLYTNGLIALDQLLSSHNAVVNARQSMIAAQVSLMLAAAKIDINNKTIY